jgi:acetyltransferase
MFNPKSVAVIGATPKEGKVGNILLKNLKDFNGNVYAVNPKYGEILGFECYPSVEKIPDEVDLAIIAVPARFVPEVLENCGKKGIRNAVVISAGFKEAGNYALENELIEVCRRYGINLAGPNCLGIINTHNNLNATFSKVMPPKGKIAFLSQSGAFILAVIDWARANNVGFSKIVSLGNKAILDEADFMEYLAKDDDTDVIMLYLEGVKDGRRFMRVARKVSKIKPIVAVKSGRTEAGARAASSHTGSLAGSFEACRAAFKQSGVIEAESIEDLFDFSLILSSVKSVEGGIAIITNSGGPGVIASDAVEEFGLELAKFEIETIEKLKSVLPPIANLYNPVDVLGDANADRFGKALEIVSDDPNVGAIVAILTPTAQIDFEKATDYVISAKKPIVTCFMGGESVEKAVERLKKNNIVNFLDPVRAVKSLRSAKWYGLIKAMKEVDEKIKLDVDVDKARSIIKGIKTKVVGADGFEILRAYGIPVPPYGIAKTAEEALEIADGIGYPVAMKIVSPDVIHKTDVGCVKLDVRREDVISAFYELVKRGEDFLKADVEGVLVQKMMPKGKETIIGMKRDPQFGSLLMFGLGGIYVEVFRDVSFRIAPISKKDAFDMIKEVKAYRLLRGVRGEKPSDINSLVDVLLRISKLSMDFEEIVEMDLNPVFVYESGCCVVDVKMVLR